MDEILSRWLDEAFASHARFRALLAPPGPDIRLLDARLERTGYAVSPAAPDDAVARGEPAPRPRDH